MGAIKSLRGIIVTVHHQVDVMFFYPVAVSDPGSVGKHFVNVAAPSYTCDAFLHRQNGFSLVSNQIVVTMDAAQKVVSESTCLFAKPNIAIVK